MIDVVWQAGLPDVADDSIVKRSTTLLPPWADCTDNGESAVNDIVDDLFRAEIDWNETVGADDDQVDIVVTVLQPESIAGRYDVTVRRVPKASARRVAPVPA